MSDPIDREALMRKFTTFVKAHGDSEPAPTWNDAVSLVGSMPSAQPKWTPIEEGPPKANGRYLVTRGLNACGAMWNRVYIINYSNLMGLKSERIWWDGNVGKSDFERIDDVLAWMPLPKRYERSEE